MTCADPGCGKTKAKCDVCRVWVRRWAVCEHGNSVAGVPFIGRIGMFGHLANKTLYNSYKDACDNATHVVAGFYVPWIIEMEVEE